MIDIYFLQSVIAKGGKESLIIIFLLLSSLSIRYLLELFNQRWIKTTAHTSTIIILPIITYVITTVISGNIALSLGMVGALSIVRFRNPVRSPLELCVYFAAITMGITAAVSISRLVFFIASIFFVSFVVYIFSQIYKKIMKKNYFTTSFSEGNTLSTLELNATKNIPEIEECAYLKSIRSSENKIEYVLISTNFQALKNILIKTIKNKDLIDYQLNEE